MNAQSRLSERLAVVATIDPDAYATGTQGSDVIDMQNRNRVLFIVQAGALGASATLDFKLQGCATANGDYADIEGKAITQLTDAGTDSEKQALVEITSEEAAALGYRYIKGVMTIGTAASDAAVVALAGDLAYYPAADYDLDSVDEIVA
jgi:hypothetical protein